MRLKQVVSLGASYCKSIYRWARDDASLFGLSERHPVLVGLWVAFWALQALFMMPGAAAMTAAHIVALTMPRLLRVIKECITECVDEVSENVATTVNNTITESTEKVVNGVERISGALNTGSMSWQNTISQAQKHPLGLSAATKSLLSAESTVDVMQQLTVLGSLLGWEQSLLNTVLARGLAATGIPAQEQGLADDLRSMASSVKSGLNSAWGQKRAIGLAALASTLAGIDVDIGTGLDRALKKQDAIEKAWDRLEEFLNALGIIDTGKYAYLKELQMRFEGLDSQFKEYNAILAVSPSWFCKSDNYKKWLRFRREVDDLRSACNKNQCGDIRNTSMFQNLNILITRVLSWDEQVANVRALEGIRVTPVGVCLVGPSQLGKTTMVKEVLYRVKKKLKALYVRDPTRYAAFADAEKWTKWSVQQRDEYDEGYYGQEIVYVDDAFADKECKDHPAFLTFISDECIGTVQARLNQKGMPFAARLVITSCNELPSKSSSINNVYALHERFKVTAAVRLRTGAIKPTPQTPYDRDFQHLDFHIAPMAEHCYLHGSTRASATCGFSNGGEPDCGVPVHTLDDIVERVYQLLVEFEDKYQSQSTRFEQMDNPYELVDYEEEVEEPWTSDMEDSDEPESFGLSDIEEEDEVSSEDEIISSEDEIEIEEAVSNLPLVHVPVEEQPDYDQAFIPPPAEFCEPSTVVPLVANAQPVMEPKIFRFLAGAFRVPAIEHIAEPRLVGWLKHLCHHETGRSAIDSCIDSSITDPVLLLRHIRNFRVIKGHEVEFQTAWMQCWRDPVRLHSERKAYVMSYRFNLGTIALPVPYVEGVVDRFDTTTDVGEWMCLMATFLKDEKVIKLKNTDFWVWRCRRSLPRYVAQQSGTGSIGALNFTCDMLLFTLPALWLGRWHIPYLGSPNTWLQLRWTNAMRANYSSFSNVSLTRVIWDKLCKNDSSKFWWKATVRTLGWAALPLAAAHEAWLKITNLVGEAFSVLSDFVTYCMVRLGEVFGISLSETWEWCISYLADLLTTKALYIVIPVFAAVLAGLCRLIRGLFGKKTEEQSITRSANRKYGKQRGASGRSVYKRTYPQEQSLTRASTVKKMRAARFKREKIRGTEQINWFDEPEEKINYYKNPQLSCPFDDLSVLKADGDFVELGDGWVSKPNKFPVTSVHRVIVSGEHWVENPFRGEYIVDEFEMAMAEHERLGRDVSVIVRNWGENSGGSVPHSHIQLLGTDEMEWPGPPEIGEVPQYPEVNIGIIADKRCIDITFWCRPECFQRVVKDLTPLMAKLGFPSFTLDAVVTMDLAVGSLSLSHTFKVDGKESLLTKSDVREVRTELRDLTKQDSNIMWNNISSVLGFQYREPGKPDFDQHQEQAYDDGSVNLMKVLVTEHTVHCYRIGGYSVQKPDDFINMEKKGAPGLGGLANKNEVWLPSHLCAKGTYFRVFEAGDTRIGDLPVDARYHVFQCVGHDELHQLARGIWIPPQKFLDMIQKDYEYSVVSCFSKLERRTEFRHRDWFSRHVMCDEEYLSSIHNKRMLQWLPRTGLITDGVVGACGTLRFNLEGKGNATHRVITINSVGSNSSVSMKGDCGGLMLLMESTIARKVLGFHVIGGEHNRWGAILTLELIEELRSQAVSQEQMWTPIIISEDETDLQRIEYIPKGIAGLGDLQIAQWPIITWSSCDPFRACVVEGIGPDTPQGPCARNIGILAYEHRVHGTHSRDEWKHSPFWGAFPIELEPSLLSTSDPRLELELPKNLLGAETLAWPNNLAAASLPQLDTHTLGLCATQVLDYFVMVMAGKPIWTPVYSPEAALDYGLNGVPFGHHMTGLVLNASAGVPWNSRPNQSQKKDLVDLLPNGRRVFKNDVLGQQLKELCIIKLQEAREGRRISSFCATKLKDCLVKTSQIQQGKTRIFNASSVESVICTNALFAPFKEEFMKLGRNAFHAIGIDVNSADWDELGRWLEWFPNHFDVDFANFDKRLKSSLLRAWKTITIETIERVHSDGWRTARYVLSEEDITSLMVDNSSVWVSEHSNKSGTAMTTMDNSGVNMLHLFYCFSKWLGRVDFNYFTENVRFVSFGDDQRVSVSDECSGFTRKVYFELLSSFGQVATPADKTDGEISPFVPCDDVQFLKGITKRHNGIRLYALEKRSIQGTFGWSKVGPERVDEWHGIIDSHLRQAMPWGEEYYEYFRNQLIERSLEDDFPRGLRMRIAPLLTRDYYSCRDLVIDSITGIAAVQQGAESINEAVQRTGGSFYNWLATLDLTQLSGQVGLLYDQLQSLGLTVQAISRKADNNESAITTLDSLFNELESEVNYNSHNIEINGERISALEDSNTDYRQELDEFSHKVDDLDLSVSSNINNIQELSDKQSDLSDRIVANKAQIKDMKEAVSNLHKSQTSLEERVTSVESDVQAHTRHLSLLDTRYEAVKKLADQNKIDSTYANDRMDDLMTGGNFARKLVESNSYGSRRLWFKLRDAIGHSEWYRVSDADYKE